MNNINVPEQSNLSNVTKEQLIADLKVVISDAEALIKATANQGGDAVATVRTKAERSLVAAKAKLADAEIALRARTKVAAKAADVYVRDNAWQTVGIAVGFGLLVGLIAGRR